MIVKEANYKHCATFYFEGTIAEETTVPFKADLKGRFLIKYDVTGKAPDIDTLEAYPYEQSAEMLRPDIAEALGLDECNILTEEEYRQKSKEVCADVFQKE